MPIIDPFDTSSNEIVDPFDAPKSAPKEAEMGGLKRVPVPEITPSSGFRQQVAASIGQGPIEQEAKVPRDLGSQYGQLAKGIPIGMASFIGSGAGIPAFGEGLVRSGLRAAGADVSPETVAPTSERVGTYWFGEPSSEYEAAARTLGEYAVPGIPLGKLKAGLSPATKAIKPETVLNRVLKTGEGISSVARKMAEEKYGVNTQKAKEAYEQAIKGVQERIEAEGGVYAQRLSQAAKKAREVVAPETVLNRVLKTGEDISSVVRKITEEKYGVGTQKATKAYEQAIKGVQERTEAEGGVYAQRLSQAAKKAREVVAPEDEAIRSTARKATGLSEPIMISDELETLAAAKYKEAEAKIKSGSQAYDTFADAATARESIVPFENTPQGQALHAQLSEISSGGSGALTEYTEPELKIATDIISELFPKKAAVVTEQQVAELAAKNPNKSMSQSAKMFQARKELEAAVSEKAAATRPVNYRVVKQKAQELRNLQETRGGPAGFKREIGSRYQEPAKMVENALKEWVGEENWPHSIYRESAKEKNSFEVSLGKILKEREEIPYSDKPGPYKTPRKDVENAVFRSKDDTRYAKELLGDDEVNRLGAAYAANETKGFDAKNFRAWMEMNDFYKEIPGLEDKLKAYGQALSKGEKEANVMKTLRSQKEKEAEAIAEEFKTVKQDIASQIETEKKSFDKKIKEFADQKDTAFKTIEEFEKTFSFDPQVAFNKKGFDAKKFRAWMERNDFYKEIPGLEDKLKAYGQALSKGEQEANVMKTLRSQKEKEAGAIVEEFKKVKKDIASQIETEKKSFDKKIKEFANQKDAAFKTIEKFEKTFSFDPQAAVNNWVELRSELEKTGVFDSAALNEFESVLNKAAKEQKSKEFTDEVKKLLTDGVKKLLGKLLSKKGLGVVGAGAAYELFKK